MIKVTKEDWEKLNDSVSLKQALGSLEQNRSLEVVAPSKNIVLKAITEYETSKRSSKIIEQIIYKDVKRGTKLDGQLFTEIEYKNAQDKLIASEKNNEANDKDYKNYVDRELDRLFGDQAEKIKKDYTQQIEYFLKHIFDYMLTPMMVTGVQRGANIYKEGDEIFCRTNLESFQILDDEGRQYSFPNAISACIFKLNNAGVFELDHLEFNSQILVDLVCGKKVLTSENLYSTLLELCQEELDDIFKTDLGEFESVRENLKAIKRKVEGLISEEKIDEQVAFYVLNSLRDALKQPLTEEKITKYYADVNQYLAEFIDKDINLSLVAILQVFYKNFNLEATFKGLIAVSNDKDISPQLMAALLSGWKEVLKNPMDDSVWNTHIENSTANNLVPLFNLTENSREAIKKKRGKVEIAKQYKNMDNFLKNQYEGEGKESFEKVMSFLADEKLLDFLNYPKIFDLFKNMIDINQMALSATELNLESKFFIDLSDIIEKYFNEVKSSSFNKEQLKADVADFILKSMESKIKKMSVGSVKNQAVYRLFTQLKGFYKAGLIDAPSFFLVLHSAVSAVSPTIYNADQKVLDYYKVVGYLKEKIAVSEQTEAMLDVLNSFLIDLKVKELKNTRPTADATFSMPPIVGAIKLLLKRGKLDGNQASLILNTMVEDAKDELQTQLKGIFSEILYLLSEEDPLGKEEATGLLTAVRAAVGKNVKAEERKEFFKHVNTFIAKHQEKEYADLNKKLDHLLIRLASKNFENPYQAKAIKTLADMLEKEGSNLTDQQRATIKNVLYEPGKENIVACSVLIETMNKAPQLSAVAYYLGVTLEAVAAKEFIKEKTNLKTFIETRPEPLKKCAQEVLDNIAKLYDKKEISSLMAYEAVSNTHALLEGDLNSEEYNKFIVKLDKTKADKKPTEMVDLAEQKNLTESMSRLSRLFRYINKKIGNFSFFKAADLIKKSSDLVEEKDKINQGLNEVEPAKKGVEHKM